MHQDPTLISSMIFGTFILGAVRRTFRSAIYIALSVAMIILCVKFFMQDPHVTPWIDTLLRWQNPIDAIQALSGLYIGTAIVLAAAAALGYGAKKLTLLAFRFSISAISRYTR